MRIISLFSGAGGMDLGLKQAGHNIVWANDIDKDCVETYRYNIGDHIVRADLAVLDLSDLPDADVVVGGFPCQGFSCANMLRDASDQRNALYLEFIRVLKAKRPQYFIAENVRGLLSLDNGSVMKMIIRDFSDAGYSVDYRLLNTADFGVPQTRRRVIIIGSRKGFPIEAKPQFPVATHGQDPSSFSDLKSWVSIGNALEGIPEPHTVNSALANHVCSQYKVTNRNFTGHRRTDPDKPSPTILARGNGGGGVCAIQHPRNHRRLSVRESAIIQTFPNDFVFFGSLNSMYRQVGNAVPVLFANQIGKQLLKVESHLYTVNENKNPRNRTMRAVSKNSTKETHYHGISRRCKKEITSFNMPQLWS